MAIARISLVLLSILLTLTVGEVGLRILDEPTSRVGGWKSRANPVESNQLGFRGHPIQYSDKDYVVVLVGDSQVEAQACAYEWLPERRLEYYLGENTKVFSVGAGGYGEDQELLALKEYFQKYRADLVILWETPANDIWNNLFPSSMPRAGTPKPTFRLVNGELVGPSEQIGVSLKTSRLKLIELLKRLTGWTRDQSWADSLPEPYKPLTSYRGEVKHDWQAEWDTDEYFRSSDLDAEKADMTISLTPRSPRMQYGLDLTRTLIREIEKTANNHGAQFIAFSHDRLRPEGVELLNGKYYVTSTRQLTENVDYMNQDVKFYWVPVTIERWRVGPQNGHLNEHAVDQLMKTLADRFR